MRGGTKPLDVEEYLAAVPEPARTTLIKVRAIIRSVVPAEATECISYGMPAFKYRGLLFAYAAFAKHCSLFPMSAALIVEFSDQLKNFETSKGTIRFPIDKPPSAALIKKLVKARIAQNEAKKKPNEKHTCCTCGHLSCSRIRATDRHVHADHARLSGIRPTFDVPSPPAIALLTGCWAAT